MYIGTEIIYLAIIHNYKNDQKDKKKNRNDNYLKWITF